MKKAHFLRSSVGRKFVVAVTGILLILFVIVHMLGNLQVFFGAEAINAYAAFLTSKPAMVWGARAGLLLTLILHVVFTIQLNLENQAARPVDYSFQNTVKATLSSRLMVLTGVLLLMYIVGHILHFTAGIIQPGHFALIDQDGRKDVYAMIVRSFQNPFVSGAYIVSMLMLWSHLSHGIMSVFQTLSLRTDITAFLIDRIAPLVSAVIVLGYISIPTAVLLGFLTVQGVA